jgi:hypothetical protein
VKLISHIAELVREKKIEGISDIQDYSDRTGMRIWIQVKRDAAAQVVLNTLYKMSDLQITFGVNMIAIVHGRPQLLSLRDCLAHFIDHRRTVVTRRSRFELHKALERREIVEGLGVAIDAIDRIIASSAARRTRTRRASPCAPSRWQGFAGFLERTGRPQAEIEAARAKPYRLNQRQAKAILDMRLQRLTGLERDKIEGEYRELCGIISYLESILADPALLMKVIRDELSAIGSEYGDARRTLVVEDEGEIEPIDLVADEPMIVMLTNNGYIKRLPSDEYRVQGRGGVGREGRRRPRHDRLRHRAVRGQRALARAAVHQHRPHVPHAGVRAAASPPRVGRQGAGQLPRPPRGRARARDGAVPRRGRRRRRALHRHDLRAGVHQADQARRVLQHPLDRHHRRDDRGGRPADRRAPDQRQAPHHADLGARHGDPLRGGRGARRWVVPPAACAAWTCAPATRWSA